VVTFCTAFLTVCFTFYLLSNKMFVCKKGACKMMLKLPPVVDLDGQIRPAFGSVPG